ncbi:dihydrodipicolinate synthase family protein [Streptomyces sp. CBMA29]|uniref:dihydrodipicolinate synthase family protein n=1 Tax=Streptomyces sp. CBMA29 TaxID=1896314 RepID=UPI0016619E88|nr:dihydrodipicolinate synthase family protein [Streptomyces sp. CBMA29]MBD0734717.1 dihydrodipicolinate synthase family protein [Streptomyces sp. CBMA29]
MTKLSAGVWGVVATPFHDDLGVDLDSLATLVGRYEELGVAGLTVLGVFGEAAKLDSAERARVLSTVIETVDLPVVVGATTLATAPVIEEAELAKRVAGDRLAGVMVQINSVAPAVLAAHLNAVHRATGVGLVVQDYPAASGVSMPLPSQLEALADVDGIVAVKAEAAPTAARVAALSERFDIPVFGGLGGIGLIDELQAGAAGAMTGFSYPEGLLATIDAYRDGGFAAAREALAPYLPLIAFEQQPGIGLAIRKACLAHRGLIAGGAVRPPAPGIPEALMPSLHHHLAAVESVVNH